MSDEPRKCTGCGARLRSQNTAAQCYKCKAKSGAYGTGSTSAGHEDSVLDRMGFGSLAKKSEADEAPPKDPPPAKKSKAKKTSPRPPSSPPAPATHAPEWQSKFRLLTAALGLDPDEMLEQWCRDWVETTRKRALPPTMPPSLALAANTNGAEASLPAEG